MNMSYNRNMCVPYMYFDYKTYSYCSIEKKNHTSISSTLKRSGNGTNNASTTGFQRRYNGGKCNGEFTICTRGRLLNLL